MASRRQTSYGSNSLSANSRGAVFCTCGGTAVVRTVKHGPNIGRKFHGCPLWPDTNCDFMKWLDDSNHMGSELEDLRYKLLEKDVIISEFEHEKKISDEKILKLEERCEDLKMELSQTQIALMMSTRNENNLSMGLWLSWLFFAVTVLLLLVVLKL
ncbi:DNA topoisomerase 3-alpha [Bienertia sinuspersici]